MNSQNKWYLGDGAYAQWQEGRGLVLTAENGIRATDTVVLEPEGLQALVDHLKAINVLVDVKSQPADRALREAEIRLDEAKKWEHLAKQHESGNDEPGHFEPDCFACERLAELRALVAQKEPVK